VTKNIIQSENRTNGKNDTPNTDGDLC